MAAIGRTYTIAGAGFDQWVHGKLNRALAAVRVWSPEDAERAALVEQLRDALVSGQASRELELALGITIT